jgi:hypothetical protein
VALLGCVSTGNLGLVIPSRADPGEFLSHPHTYRDLGPTEGQACRYFLLSLVPWGDSTLARAVDDALRPKGGDVLLNVSASTSLYGFIPYYNVFAFTCTTVKGVAVKLEVP